MSAIKMAPSFSSVKSAVRPKSRTRNKSKLALEPPHLIDLVVERMDIDDYAQQQTSFDDLVTRTTEPNIFAHPRFVEALARTISTPNTLHPLVSWGNYSDGSRKMLGVWVLRETRLPNMPFASVLSPRTSPFTDISTPLLDQCHAETALASMLDYLETTAGLPKIIHCEALSANGQVIFTLLGLLNKTRRPSCLQARFTRHRLDCHAQRQQQNVLSQSLDTLRLQFGERLTYTTHTNRDISEALEEFLALEASGWQGHSGQAIICDHASAALLRASLPVLAKEGLAGLSALRLDGKALRMGLLLRSRDQAWLVRTAFDESASHLSASLPYVQALNASLLECSEVASVDSCLASTTALVAESWSTTQPMLNMMFDVRAQGSLMFDLVHAAAFIKKWSRKLRS